MSNDNVFGGPTVQQMRDALRNEEYEEAMLERERWRSLALDAQRERDKLVKDLLKESANLAALRIELMTREREHAARVHSDRERIVVAVTALRTLACCAASNLEGSIVVADVDNWVKAHREALELLAIIDGQQGGK